MKDSVKKRRGKNKNRSAKSRDQQGEIDLPDTIQDIWCDVFENGTFSEKVVFSPNLWMLGMRAFGSNCTGLEKVFFTGDAPEIFDYPDSWGDEKVFPDTTTAIYYPKDNASWDDFDFSRLANNAQLISYMNKYSSIYMVNIDNNLQKIL